MNYEDNARKFDRKESCMQGHFIDKTDGKDPKKKRKILDTNIENNRTLWT